MQNQENNHQSSGTEVVTRDDRTSHTASLNKRGRNRRTSSFVVPDTSDFVEITLDVGEDSVALSSIKATEGRILADPELSTALPNALEKKSSLGSSITRNASSRIKQVSREVKRLASLTSRPDEHPAERLDRTESAALSALKTLEFISKTDAAWDVVEKRFDAITAKTNGLLPRPRFGECIGLVVDRNKESKEFACELFDALARRRNISGDSINKVQLKECWDLVCDQSFDSRLQTFFDMVDRNGDGRITEEEVREIITVSASANKLSSIQNKADEYARLIMEELDTDNHGYILIENLEMVLLQGPMHAVRGDGETCKLNKMLSEKLKPTQDRFLKRLYDDLHYFLTDNWQRAWVLALWMGIMAGLFTWKYIQYWNRAAYEVMGACVSLAKGAAETLKLNMALILLPVCRNTITWLRNKTKLGMAVPFDDNLNFHKVIAIAIGIGVGIHGISHLACDFPRLLSATPEEYEPMEQYFGHQPKSYWHFVRDWVGVTGIIMVVLMAIAFLLASPWFRRNRLKLPMPLKRLTGFNAFWYSHHLFVIVYACLIIHGIKIYLTHEWQKKTTWMYLAFPVVLYAVERLIRALRSSVKAVKILKVALYPGNVLGLHMSKPHGFRYKSGQYIFVNCAAVSEFEWHPFSVTSAPMDDYISVHIRTAGDWTKHLLAEFSKVCQPLATGRNGFLEADCSQGHNNPDFPRVLIDGPYGAPTQDYKHYDVVVLVGLGIGATPMISVVKDILNNMKAMEEEENAMEEGTTPSPNARSSTPRHNSGSGSGQRHFKTSKAYFYWVTREQGSFDWFKGVMNEVAEMDHKGVIEMWNYCTSVYEEGDARCALITMLQSLNHAKNGVDVVSGTRVKSHFAKPNWREVYKRIALNHPNSRVGVFYCGAPLLVKELRHLASDFSHKTSTKFEFHKENF